MIINIFAYILLALLLTFAISEEKRDLFCPDGCTSWDSNLCKDGNGKYYNDGKITNTDSVTDTLEKIAYLTDTDDRTVKWRRSIIISIIIVIAISIMILNRVPTGSELFLYTGIIFIGIYSSFSFYEFHYYKYPKQYVKDAVQSVRMRVSESK